MSNNIIYTIENNKQIVAKGTYTGLLKDIENKRNKEFKNSHNKTQFETYTTNEDSSHKEFAGGTWEDVTNLSNMESFKEQLKEFRKNKLEEKVMTRIDFSPKRKRNLSEHDGDYDHEKRYEIKPFSSSRKEMLPISVIDVNVDMSINCSMKAKDINKYGALVWSVIQMVESLGIQCNINVINDCTGIGSKGNKYYDGKLSLVIKKAGEYISPVALATCFQAVFFRRAIFTGMVLECEENDGIEVSYGLGSPRIQRTDKHIWFEKGCIYTRAGGAFDAKEVEEAIVTMITTGKK